MPVYDYSAIKKDPAKQQEIVKVCDDLEKFFRQQDWKGTNEGQKTLEALGYLKEMVQGNAPQDHVEALGNYDDPEANFASAMLFLRGRMVYINEYHPEMIAAMKQAVPGAEGLLEGIDMPQKGTAGYACDLSHDDYLYTYSYYGPHSFRLDSLAADNHLATVYAILDQTGSGDGWRKKPIVQQELEKRRTGLSRKLDPNDVKSDLDQDDGTCRQLLQSADGDVIEDFYNDYYYDKILPQSVEITRQDNQSNQPPMLNNAVEIDMPLILRGNLFEKLGRKKFKTFQDMEKLVDRQYAHLYEGFYNSFKENPMKLRSLLSADPAEGALLKAINEYAPTAKERIEKLQTAAQKKPTREQKYDLLAEIIAVREEVEAKRGGAGLEKRPAPEKVAQRKEEVKKQLEALYGQDPKALDVLYGKAVSRSGHGGAMLEDYRDAIQKNLLRETRLGLDLGLDPAKMPTAKERIEILRDAIVKDPHASQEVQARRLAEIIAARESVGAKPNGQGLTKTMPGDLRSLVLRSDELTRQLMVLPESDFVVLRDSVVNSRDHGAELEKKYNSAFYQDAISMYQSEKEHEWTKMDWKGVMEALQEDLRKADENNKDQILAKIVYVNAYKDAGLSPERTREILSLESQNLAAATIMSTPEFTKFKELLTDENIEAAKAGNPYAVTDVFDKATKAVADEKERQSSLQSAQNSAVEKAGEEKEPEKEASI